MSLYSVKSQAIFEGAERRSLEPTEEFDHLDILEKCPRGKCPWCGGSLFPAADLEIQPYPFCSNTRCLGRDWHADETEDENRIRFAAETLENASVP